MRHPRFSLLTPPRPVQRSLARAPRLRAKVGLSRRISQAPSALGGLSRQQLFHLVNELMVRQRALVQQNQELMRTAVNFDTMPDGFWRLDLDGILLDVNSSYCLQSGYRRDELLGRSLADFDAVPSPITAGQRIEQWAKAGQQVFEIRHRRKDGSVWDVEVNVRFYDRDGGQVDAFLRGISAHARDTTELADSEERWKLALEGAGEGVWDWHINTGYAVFSTRYKAMLGYAEDEIGNQASEWSNRVHPDDMPQVMQILQDHLNGKTSAARIEFRAHCKDGSWRWILGRGMVVTRDAQGKPLRLVGTNIDIHAQKLAQLQEQLRTQVLDMLSGDAPCGQVLQALVLALERMTPGVLCSILLLDPTGHRFADHVAPSLPDFFARALVGLATGVGVASCGTAAFLGERVVVPEIATNDYWHGFRELAARAGLTACWSQPIRGSGGRILGTLAMYGGQLHQPDATEVALVESSAHLASIVIEKYQTAEKLRASEDRYRTIVENSPDPVGVFRDGRLIYVNAAAINLLRATSAQDLLGRSMLSLVHSDDRLLMQMSTEALVQAGAVTPLREERLLRLDGTVVNVEVQSTLMVLGGAPVIHTVARDITLRKESQDKLRLAAAVFSHAREGILILSLDGIIIDLNDAVTQLTGYSRGEVLGHFARERFCAGLQGPEVFEAMEQSLRRHGSWSGELWNRRKNGEVFATLQAVSVVRDESGAEQNMVVLFSDISVLKDHERELEQLAHFDVLTGLPNRVLLSDRMRQAMAQALRRKQCLAMVYLDLDGFKLVNDRLGHAVGDCVLATVAHRMKQTLREGDTLACVGGDEFVAVLPDLERANCNTMMLRLLDAAAQPVWIDGVPLQISASLGVTFYPQLADLTADLLLSQADQAMYLAKLSGKNCYHMFDTDGLA